MMLADPEFRAEAEQLKLPLAPRAGEELQQTVADTFKITSSRRSSGHDEQAVIQWSFHRMNDYPMLHFLMRWGKLAAAGLALAVLAAGLWAALGSGQWLWAIAGVVVAGVGYALALSYVELIRVIVDMLLPKP
jgi:hypothetical protein